MQDKRENIDKPDEELFIKYLSNNITAAEKSEVEEWLRENQENEKILNLLAQIYSAQKTQQRILNRDSELVFNTLQHKIKGKARRLLLQKISVAASFFIGIIGICSLIYMEKQEVGTTTPAMVTVYSNNSSLTQVVLPDNTEVTLNRGSSLTYPHFYSKDRREVVLDGEAFFKVAHDANHPFIVSNLNKTYNVKVLGTEFNMQTNENTINTTLVSGSVELEIPNKQPKTILSPSQKATYSLSTHQLQIAEVNTDRETDWMFNRLVFKNTPMPEVLASLSHFYNVEFIVANKVINTYVLTGIFEDKPLSQVLDYIKVSSKINYKTTFKEHENSKTSVIRLSK